MRPASERNIAELKTNLNYARLSIFLGIMISGILLIGWAIPYMNAVAN